MSNGMMAKGHRHQDCFNPHGPLANPPGHNLTKKGYWRIHARGAHRNKYLHRWVIEAITGEVPGEDKEIHHIDMDPKNCCPYNLAIMDYALHQSLDNSSRLGMEKGQRGFKKRPSPNEEVDWLVVEMILADWRGEGKTWSPLKALENRNPAARQQDLFTD